MNKAMTWAHAHRQFKTDTPRPRIFGTRFSNNGSYPYQKELATVNDDGCLLIGGEIFYGAENHSGKDEIKELVDWLVEVFLKDKR